MPTVHQEHVAAYYLHKAHRCQSAGLVDTADNFFRAYEKTTRSGYRHFREKPRKTKTER